MSSKRKRGSQAEESGEEQSIEVCEISPKRKVSVRKWRGQVLVDIREFWYKDDQRLPGKKGISLTLEQWNVLQDHVDQIDSAIQRVN